VSADKITSVTDLQKDLATRHQSLERSNVNALSKQTLIDFEVLQRQGYVVMENLLNENKIQEIGEQVVPLLNHVGRNNFEGLKTQRIYNVLEQTRAVDELSVHSRITGLLDNLFQPNYLLSQLQVINILSGEEAQPLHYDDGFYQINRPRPALGAAAIWAIDDFTNANGATVVVPKSHTFGQEPVTDSKLGIPVEMSAGSVVFFLGTLWHGGGANFTNESRLAVTCQYCEPWLRPQENFFLELSKNTLKKLPDELLSMVGYSIHPPFMGMVNGMHPKRVL
jgi:ectoine hydroxylase-related dioxygenase (phytanoyl-CoA dioxygenase family)